MNSVMPYNIIYVHTHDSGRVFSPYGYKAPSPNLENFSEEALLLRNAFCVSPTCSPSRSGLLTGMYPHSNGMLGLANRGFEINDMGKHIVTTLKNNGYNTVLCGIQHEYGHYMDHAAAAEKIGYNEDITFNTKRKDMQEPDNWDYENAKNVSEWINKNGKSGPFFLSFGMFSTHREYPEANKDIINPDRVVPPYPVPDNAVTREDYSRHLVSVKYADDCFKTVIDALKEAGIYDNTVVIFTTDHGIAFPFSKCTLYDAGTGVALIVRVPDSKANGTVTDNLVSQVDVFPTLCDILGIEKPDWLQGISFAPYFAGDLSPLRDKVIAEINYHTSYEPVRSIRTERYKYIRFYDTDYLKINLSNIDESVSKDLYLNNSLELKAKPAEALYDLLYDPGERNNLVSDINYNKVLGDMRDAMEKWQTETGDPIKNGQIEKLSQWKVNKKTSRIPSSRDPDDYEG